MTFLYFLANATIAFVYTQGGNYFKTDMPMQQEKYKYSHFL